MKCSFLLPQFSLNITLRQWHTDIIPTIKHLQDGFYKFSTGPGAISWITVRIVNEYTYGILVNGYPAIYLNMMLNLVRGGL
jgi:hypothetical protein